MPKAVVKIYDSDNNEVAELPYGKNGIEGIETDGQRQAVYKDIDREGNEYFTAGNDLDPFIRAGKDIETIVNIQAPQLKINDNNRITISAPKNVLSSPFVAQLKEQSQVLKGQDLNDPEIQKAIETMNEEIKASVESQMIEESFGWTPEQYKDYQYTVQTTKTTNPMKSSNKIKGVDKDGNIVEKTPAEWEKYYQENYNVDDRTDAYLKSIQATNPYERTMYMVLSDAGANGYKPVRGYTNQDRINQFLATAGDEVMQLKELPQWIITTNEDTRRAETTARGKGLDPKFMRMGIESEEEFNKKKEEIKGKAWSELTDEEKAFVIKVGATIERNFGFEMDEKELEERADKKHRGSKTNTYAWDTNEQDYERTKSKVRREYETSFLNNAVSDNDDDSRNAINTIMNHDSSLEKFMNITNDLEEQYKYLDEKQAYQDKLDKNALWASSEQMWGRIGGTLARYIIEDLIVYALTGGMVKMSGLSGGIANSITGILAKKGIAPTSRIGKTLLRFGAELVGTIPEDIIQTAVDNTLTNNPQDNQNLFSAQDLEGNLKMNFIIMAGFNAARAGVNAVKNNRMLKDAAKQLDMSAPLDIEGIVSDSDDIVRAVKNGGTIDTDGVTVKIHDPISGEKELKNITPEQGKLIQNALFDIDAEAPLVKRDVGVDLETDDAARSANKADVDTPTNKMATVEIDSPEGRVKVETPDYSFSGVQDALSSKVHATPAGIKQWHIRALEATMAPFQTNLDNFHNKFGDVRASDFDWVWYNTKRGLTPSQIIGTVDPTTNRVVTQNMIDAMKWWSDQPFVKDLRKASLEGLEKGGDFDTLGYLPHTTYNPASLSFEDAITGQLWQRATGKSVLTDTGAYKGFGGDFEKRYRTFASNMLWDAKRRDILTAKMMEVAELDGNTVTPEVARKAVDSELNIRKGTEEAVSTKDLVKILEKSTDVDEVDWDKLNTEITKQAKKSGVGKAFHDVYGDIYSGANTAVVKSQPSVVGNNLSQLSDSLKRTVIILDGKPTSLYDFGGADLSYAYQNAGEIISRYRREGGSLREMLTEYVVNHSQRPQKYAEAVVDKWMMRLGEVSGTLDSYKAIEVLGKSMKGEAWSRIKKWLVNAQYNDFNSSTKKNIDNFLFRHMQEDAVTNNKKLIRKLAKMGDVLTGLRYRSLFYGNFKNAILQTSELNRFFYTFKWGDVGSMAKRMSTDATFRARVDDYVDAVMPNTTKLEAEVYGNYSKLADTMEVTETETIFNKMKGKADEVKDTIDGIALQPINTAEGFKNRMMMAAIVAETDNLGLTGDDALRHIRNRFERVALAQNEMGRIGLANNRLARMFLFLQNFQIRELGMNYYNIRDILSQQISLPKKVYQATAYITKLLGAKLGTAFILTRLGYSPGQALGIDPFGLLEENRYLKPEEMDWRDKIMDSPLFAGGMTSLISELYFMSRKAYEESQKQSVSEEVDETINNTWGLAMPDEAASGEYFGKLASGFLPGNTFFSRLGQTNEMMDTGWAVSSSGNRMYTAPTDPFNIVMAYLFGRNATQNAQQYNQTSGDNLWQTLGRMNPLRSFNEFDPIDDKNYTDWFKGDGNDEQQFSKGIYHFRAKKQEIVEEYEKAINSRFITDDELEKAKNEMNLRLEDLFDQLERFVEAYEEKNGTITQAMVKQILQILNTSRRSINDTREQANDASMDGYNDSLRRYTQHGFSPVGTYTGPTEYDPNKEVSYQGSPQWRAARGGLYNMDDEIVEVLKLADAKLKPLRNDLKDDISEAYEREDWDMLNALQAEYLDEFDKVVSPIVALYGVEILKKTGPAEQMKAMLSTGTETRSANLIPSEQYKKDKYGRFRSMPTQEVSVSKWAQTHFGNDIYKKPTATSFSTAKEDLAEVKKLSQSNKPGRARAKALQLKARVDAQTRTLPPEDYKWLTEFINK